MNNNEKSIHLVICNNKYYYFDMEKETITNEFSLSDFLIDLYEKDYNHLSKSIELLLNNSTKEFYKKFGDMLSHIGTIECKIFYGKEIKKALNQPLEVYSFKSYHDFVLFVIYRAASSNIHFNQCKNCDRYFVPTAKSNEIYCTRIYRNNKTCRDIGYENSIQSDAISKAYRNAYKTQNAKKQRNKDIPNIDEQFSEWVSSAREMYKLCKDNKIKLDKFSKWLKDHQDWINK